MQYSPCRWGMLTGVKLVLTGVKLARCHRIVSGGAGIWTNRMPETQHIHGIYCRPQNTILMLNQVAETSHHELSRTQGQVDGPRSALAWWALASPHLSIPEVPCFWNEAVSSCPTQRTVSLCRSHRVANVKVFWIGKKGLYQILLL